MAVNVPEVGIPVQMAAVYRMAQGTRRINCLV